MFVSTICCKSDSIVMIFIFSPCKMFSCFRWRSYKVGLARRCLVPCW